MTRHLPKDEWLHLAPEHLGRVRVNHVGVGCSGSRESMIITRNEDGIRAYCYRCNRSGFVGLVRHYKPHQLSAGGSAPCAAPPALVPPADAHGGFGGWPRDVKDWLFKAGVSTVISGEMGLLWSDSQQKLWVPIRQYSRMTTGHKEQGYIVRGFSPKSYLTRTDKKDDLFGVYVSNNSFDGRVCLVEDVFSARRCASAGWDAIALLGVGLKPAVIEYVLKNGYREVIVFLDGDKPEVKMSSRKIAKRFPFATTRIIETGSDPKSYTEQQLKELLT